MFQNALSRMLLISHQMFVVIGFQETFFDFSFQKMYYFHLQRMPWSDAERSCKSINGSLATVFDGSTMYELNITIPIRFWIGLHLNTTDTVTDVYWTAGSKVIYTNWYRFDDVEGEFCAAVETFPPFLWTLESCNTSLPYICEVDTENPCDFSKTPESSLTSLNSEYLIDENFSSCHMVCLTNNHLICRSFGYNSRRRFCQFSSSNRYLSPGYFTTNDYEWDYYNKQCLFGKIKEEIQNNSTEEKLNYFILGNYICRPIVDSLTWNNQSTSVDVQILQDMGKKSKEKSKTLSRNSSPDSRPSAVAVGYTTLIIVGTFLSAIVLLDILTISRNCHHCRKSKKNGRKTPYSNKIDKLPRPLSERLRTHLDHINTPKQDGNTLSKMSSDFDHHSICSTSDQQRFRLEFFRSYNLPTFKQQTFTNWS